MTDGYLDQSALRDSDGPQARPMTCENPLKDGFLDRKFPVCIFGVMAENIEGESTTASDSR